MLDLSYADELLAEGSGFPQFASDTPDQPAAVRSASQQDGGTSGEVVLVASWASRTGFWPPEIVAATLGARLKRQPHSAP